MPEWISGSARQLANAAQDLGNDGRLLEPQRLAVAGPNRISLLPNSPLRQAQFGRYCLCVASGPLRPKATPTALPYMPRFRPQFSDAASSGADRLNASSFDRLAVASGCGHGVTAQGEAARREGCFRGEVTDTRCCQAKGFHGRCGAARVTVLPDSCRTAAQDGWSRLRCSRDSLLVVGAAVVKLTVEHQGQSEGEE